MKPAAAALLLLVFVLLPVLVLPLSAQDEGLPAEGGGSQGDLFEEGLFEEPAEQAGGEAEAPAPEEAFLVSERLEWGGSFELALDAMVSWDGYPAPWEDEFWRTPASLGTWLYTDLFFDARPERDFRVFGKVKAEYAYPAEWDIRIFELFADFQYKDLLFFRAGKQTVQWGVGYFFSPADVLSLVSIDTEDPEAEREGPIAIKAHLPFAAHNAYLYLVANDIDRPREIAVAPKLELLLDRYELGIGAFYQVDLAPKGMLTLTGPLWDLDLFAEAMVQWGSDRIFVRPSPVDPFYEPYSVEGEPLFSGTAGFGYRNPDWDIVLVAQYYYNGQAYEDGQLPALALQALEDGAINSTDLLYPGRHYLAAGLNWFEILDSRFTFSLLYLANFSDGSGLINPSLSWAPIEYLSFTTGLRITYSDDPGGDEYAPAGGALAWTLSASIGGLF
ncbi:MAG: hypothetical protein JXB06_14535 [Spirochaetales bacterium]|nr:hypothetical protein [Spirochaetales bacterium]